MKWLALLAWLLVRDAQSANILAMLPMPGSIQRNTYMPIFKELARRGHNVTTLSPSARHQQIPNLHEITITDVFGQFIRDVHERELIQMNNAWFTLFGFRYLCKMVLDDITELPELKTFLNDTTSKYDLIIVEAFNCQEPFLALGHKYGAPVVAVLSNSDLGPSVSDLTGNTFSSAYVPNQKFSFSDRMNFWERLINVMINWMDIFIDKIYWIYLDYYMRSYFVFPGYENLPALTDMIKNISLFLIDTHISLGYPRPYLPNVIKYGGHITEPATKLPKDQEKFLNDSKDGAILLDWGQIDISYFSPAILKIFLPVLAKLKQRVLIKWKKDLLPGEPENIFITPKLHQASVLAHPNVRLFISHGGFRGISEAIYNGVPLLGTPIFGNNFHNLKMVVDAGIGLTVDINSLTKQHLQDVLNDLLNNASYKERVMKKSKILRDRAMSPLDTVIYWLEYVLRHSGAAHLRPARLELAWYQCWVIEILALLVVLYICARLLVTNSSIVRDNSRNGC